MPERSGFNVKVPVGLRERVEACAERECLPVPDFVRAAIATHCRRVERQQRQDRAYEEAYPEQGQAA